MFSPATIESIQAYVYVLADAEDKIFYVGKGRGNRVFDHVEEVRRWVVENPAQPFPQTEDDDDSEASGMSLKQQRIAELLQAKFEPAMYVVREGLTDEQAFLVEAVLISVLDWQLKGALSNGVAGCGEARFGLKSVQELEAIRGAPFRLSALSELAVAATPNTPHKAIAININRRWSEVVANQATLLQVSEGRWKVSLKNASQCRYAIIHANGIVRGVFEIDHWEGPGADGRYQFVPVDPAPLLGEGFSNKNASSLFGPAGGGVRNPIRYVQLPQ